MIYRVTVNATADVRERWTVNVPDGVDGDAGALHDAIWKKIANGDATFEDQDVSGERDRDIAGVERLPDAPAPLEAELKEARELGKNEAAAAATWTVDGNTPRETVRALLAGIEDGDPGILDRFEAPNLSGEMADARTPAALARELGLDGDDLEGEAFDAVCEAYEAGVDEAFLPAVEAELRRALDEEAGS
jgi:hypothetical protein